MVDRYGEPDVMAEFAEEYLKQFWTLMPTGQLPNRLSETMPPLLLLFTATELAVKAFWIRSEKPVKPSHSLQDLYKELDPEHKDEIERRFGSSQANSALFALDIELPTIEAILGVYSDTYSGSNVHMDSRYYAEPTTMLPRSSNLRGANLVKGNTPYPIFLPDVVRALIDTYRLFSGPERLRRLGADLVGNFRDSGNDNHGDWGLIPSSLGLVVVSVPQKAGMDAKGEDLKVYEAFKQSHPTGLTADWMYGGNTLLFYWDGKREFSDGKQVIEGLECGVWVKGRLGLHARELNRLADALEAAGHGEECFGELLLQREGDVASSPSSQ